ncbi:MAG: TRAP transporter small permease subunit [Desulfobacteraceae bacterium]|nr:MAG: TRAP transporter small permease subunit [Desulfobacteraceae bacterium]
MKGLAGRIVDRLENIYTYVAAFTLALMSVLICLDAVCRYVLGYPITGVLEITEEYLMVCTVFLALSYTLTQGGHVRVVILTQFLPSKFNRVSSRFLNVVALGYCLLILITGIQMFIDDFVNHCLSRSSLEYPLAPARFILVAGVGLLCFRIVQIIVSRHKAGGEGGTEDDPEK